MSRLIIIIVILGCALPTFSQTISDQPCQVSEAPKLRGFSLGQTPSEIEELLPGFQGAFNNAIPSRTNTGVIIVSSTPVFYKRSGIRQVPNKDFEDVDFFWHFFDRRLYFLIAQYREYDPPNIQSFVKQVAEKTKLPSGGWILPDKYHAILKCKGFKIELWTGRLVERSYYQDSATVSLTDTVVAAEIIRRMREEAEHEKNAERERQRREEERLRRERERRRIFRP